MKGKKNKNVPKAWEKKLADTFESFFFLVSLLDL